MNLMKKILIDIVIGEDAKYVGVNIIKFT